MSTGAGSSHHVTDPPPLLDGPFQSDVSRIDKLENLIMTQNQQKQVFQDIIMNFLGMEYRDEEGYNYPEDSDVPLTQADPPSVSCSDSEQVAQTPPVAPAVNLVDNEEPKDSWVFCDNAASGKPLSAPVAQNLVHMFTKKLDEGKVTEAAEKYTTPDNVSCMKVPTVNEEIWNSVSPKVRSKDIKAQRTQKFLLKGMTAMLTDVNEPPEALKDAVALLTAANAELNVLRREVFKAELNPKFLPLCKPSVPVTDYLFGDDLGQTIRDLDATQKTTSQVMRGRRFSFRDRPYIRRGSFGATRGKSPFLSQGQPHQMLYPMNQFRGRGGGRGRRQSWQPMQQRQLVQAQQPQ